jgi:hypothetical protein
VTVAMKASRHWQQIMVSSRGQAKVPKSPRRHSNEEREEANGNRCPIEAWAAIGVLDDAAHPGHGEDREDLRPDLCQVNAAHWPAPLVIDWSVMDVAGRRLQRSARCWPTLAPWSGFAHGLPVPSRPFHAGDQECNGIVANWAAMPGRGLMLPLPLSEAQVGDAGFSGAQADGTARSAEVNAAVAFGVLRGRRNDLRRVRTVWAPYVIRVEVADAAAYERW